MEGRIFTIVKKWFLILMTSGLLVFSCKKNNDSVPRVLVDEYIDLTFPSYYTLNAVNGWIYYPGGNKGIIIFRRSGSEFVAFDRTCTYDASEPCSIVEVETSSIIAVDSCCGSRFSLYDGTVVNAPANQNLLQYNAVLQGNILHIYN